MARLLLCLLLLLSPLPLLRAESVPHWMEVKTEHFNVYTDGSDHQARQISAQLERMRGLFAKLLPHATADAGSQIVVLALKDRKGFQSVEPSAYLAKGSLDLAGLFLQTQDRSYILLRLDTQGEHPYATVYHEYTHYVLRHVQGLPVWLNEGLAQFYQNTDLDDKTARFGQPASNEVMFLRNQRLIPLPTLLAVDQSSPFYHEQDKGNIFYAESWALTHMLYLREFQNHTSHLQEYVSALAKGEDPVTAASRIFGDLKQLQKDLDNYVNQTSFSLLSTPLTNTVPEASLRVEPVLTADADAVRADVLIEDGRKEDGEKLAQAVLAESPGNPQAHESMGMLALRNGDPTAARKWYGEAVALHSRSYLAYYYFGSLSQQFGKGGADAPTDEAIRASLQEAIELNPRFAPALDSLARFDATHEQLDEALSMELRAVGADPRNVAYRMNAAQIRVQRKEFDAAVAVLQTTLKVAGTPEEREQVQSRLNSMESFVAQQKQREKELANPTAPASEVSTASAATPERVTGSSKYIPPYVTDGHGHRVEAGRAVDPPNLPPGPPNGPHHTVRGTLHGIGCFYPKGLVLNVEDSGKSVPLYSNDMYSIAFTAANFTPKDALNPCAEFDGLKASVVYAEVSGQPVAGQIVSMELSK